MGIQLNGIKLLFSAHKRGVPFDNVLTIGRLGLRPQRNQLQSLLLAQAVSEAEDENWLDSLNTEKVLSILGAEHVDSLDYSDYQNCTIIHDLNKPLPQQYHRKYDAVIEGGTIEHVFNAPQALKSCLDAVKLGGRIYFLQNGSNFYGHGFYTFCPEFFFSALSQRYGFEVELFLIYEHDSPDVLYEVYSPEKTGKSVRIMTGQPTSVLVQAKRVGEGEDIIESPPNQIGYEVMWREPNKKWSKVAVPGQAMKRKSFLHGKPWYELWKWKRSLRRNAKKRTSALGLKERDILGRFEFDL